MSRSCRRVPPHGLRCLCVGPTDGGLDEVRQNRRLGGAIQVRAYGAIRGKPAWDRYRGASEIRKSVAGSGHQSDPAEDSSEDIDRVIPLINERLVRLLVRSLTRILERQQLNPHITRRDRGSELSLGIIAVASFGTIISAEAAVGPSTAIETNAGLDPYRASRAVTNVCQALL